MRAAISCSGVSLDGGAGGGGGAATGAGAASGRPGARGEGRANIRPSLFPASLVPPPRRTPRIPFANTSPLLGASPWKAERAASPPNACPPPIRPARPTVRPPGTAERTAPNPPSNATSPGDTSGRNPRDTSYFCARSSPSADPAPPPAIAAGTAPSPVGAPAANPPIDPATAGTTRSAPVTPTSVQVGSGAAGADILNRSSWTC